MKLFKTLAVGLVAVAAINVASASVLRITGSTAFRKAMYAGIVAQMGSGVVKAAYVGTGGSAFNGSNQTVFVNASDTVYCCMAGSTGGINWNSNGLTVSTDKDRTLMTSAWLNPSLAVDTVTLGGATGYAITGGTEIVNPTAADPAVYEAANTANINMADTAQNATAYSTFLGNPGLTPVGAALGVQQYVFAKGKEYANVTAFNAASYARFTNVTPLAFQYLAAAGTAPLSLFTGNSADHGIDVSLVGRDNDSGTRAVTFYETGTGNDTTTAVQYQAFKADGTTNVGTTNSGPIDQLIDSDTVTVTNPGLNGYSSGGFVKNVLNASGTAVTGVSSVNGNPTILLAYIGTGDTPSTISQVLGYNGVQLYSGPVASGQATQVPALSQYGQYSFWNPEIMYQKGLTGTSGNVATQLGLATAIANNIRTTHITASGGIKTTDMQSSRPGEGQAISPN